MYKYLFVCFVFLASISVYGQRTLKTLEGGGGRPNTSKGIGNDSLFDRGSKKIAKNTEAKMS